MTVKAHPTPTTCIVGNTITVAKAPKKQRNMLLVAVTDADLSGKRSTKSVCDALKIACEVKPTSKDDGLQ